MKPLTMHAKFQKRIEKLEAENESLKGFLLCELDHAKAFVGLAGEIEKSNMQMLINRIEQALKGGK